MAKFGYLYLNEGEWDGRQLVPEECVDAATTEHARDPDIGGYGYQWWTLDDGYQAAGIGGQIIRVIPAHDLVVVFTAGMPRWNLAQLDQWVRHYIVPAVVSDDPLPADPTAHERLADAVADAAAAPEPHPVVMPDLAEEIDGVWFEARDNDEGWQGFRVEFRDDTMIVSGDDEVDGPYRYAIGVDGRYRVDEDEQVALRGEWRRDDHFVLEGHIIGEAQRISEGWVFDGDTVTITSSNAVTGQSTTLVADRVD